MPTTAPTRVLADSRARRQKSEQDTQLLFDNNERDFKAKFPGLADGVLKRSAEVRAYLREYFGKLDAIRSSGRYTADGEAAELQLAWQGARERLGKFKASTVDELTKQIDAKKAALLKPAQAATDAVTYLKQRELRDQARLMDPLKLRTYLRNSPELLAALESDPAVAFAPIVPANVLREAREALMLGTSPELTELDQLRAAYSRMLGTARQLADEAVGNELVDTRPGTPEPL
jgi:hypothetical protein